MKKNTRDNLFFGISVLILIFSLVGTFNTYFEVAEFTKSFTGYAVANGSVNVTVRETALVNFTSSNVNWGKGSVLEEQDYATIDTEGNIVGGSWNATDEGLVIRNEGNVNISLNLTTGKNAEALIGGTNSSYKFKVRDIEEGACTPPAGFVQNVKYDAGSNVKVCDLFLTNTSIRVDIELVIPAYSNLGILSDNLRVKYQQVS